jgi:hypothetical protein
LREWLSSKHKRDIFWVTGKPGSGKSTLLKAISQHRNFGALLRTWTGGGDYVIAEHFLWIAGTTMQRSLVGVLQALLHGILVKLDVEDDLELLKTICDSRWTTQKQGRLPWNCDELKEALCRACSSDQLKVILIIDGLDECESQYHKTLLDDLVDINTCDAVKIIVSSRPWPVFERRLQHSPHFRLEDLNFFDMWSHVQTRLVEAEEDGQRHSDFREQTVDALRVIAQVSLQAEGVFFWTSLILRALADEVSKGEATSTLLDLVQSYPKDLEHYFREQIYGRVSKTHKNQIDTANTLKLMLLIEKHGLLCYRGGCLIAFFFLFSGDLFRPLCDLQVQWYSNDEAVRRRKYITSTLHKTCGDMLQIRPDSEIPLSSTVSFMHRTAFDFLHEDEIMSFIEGNCAPSLRGDVTLDELAYMCFYGIMRQESLPCGSVVSMFKEFRKASHDNKDNVSLNTSDRDRCESALIQQCIKYCSCQNEMRLGSQNPHWGIELSKDCFSLGLLQYSMGIMQARPGLAFFKFSMSNTVWTNHLII